MLTELGSAPTVVDLDEGRVEIWTPRPDFVLTRVEGRMLLEHAGAVMKAVDAAIASRPGQVLLVHDWTAIHSYQVQVHAQMSAWTVRTIGDVRRIVIGVASPLVALAVRTVNLAVGHRFELYGSRDEVESKARELLR